MSKIFKTLGLLIAAPFFVVILYLVAALIGGIIPSGINSFADNDDRSQTRSIYLLSNAMHADIAIPVTDETRELFSFLKQSSFPINNPNLEYLVIGWGSRDFYTSTAEYSDIELATVWKAATGDNAVMHVAPAGDITKTAESLKIEMGQKGFNEMLAFILESFKRQDGEPRLLPDATFGYGDVFYEGVGSFNIFMPCNVWVSRALARGGVSTGLWTPTTYSLLVHHKLYH